MNRNSLVAALFASSLLCTSAVQVHAQDAAPVERIIPARVFITESCPLSVESKSDGNPESSSGNPVSDLLVGVVGDVAKAGLNALAATLEEASRAKAMGGEGTTSFYFYSLSRDGDRAILTSRIGLGQEGCLILSMDARPGSKTPELRGDLKQIQAFKRNMEAEEQLKMLPAPGFYMQATLENMGDGFVIKPNLVWYGQAMRGASDSPMPLELHASFYSVASGKDEPTPFAVARISLPPIAPGTILFSSELKGYSSKVLALRPTSGSVDEARSTVTNALSALTTRRQENKVAARTKGHAEDASAAKPADLKLKAALTAAVDQLDDADTANAASVEYASIVLKDGTSKSLGATAVVARAVVIKDPNAFGLAIAHGLSSHADTVAQDTSALLAAALADKPAKPAWTTTETAYVTALSAVNTAKVGYDKAMSENDTAAQASARQNVVLAKANANAAAVGAGLAIPYPNLLSEIGGAP